MSNRLVPDAVIDSLASVALYGPDRLLAAWLDVNLGFHWARVDEPSEDDDWTVVTDTPTDPSHIDGAAFGALLVDANERAVAEWRRRETPYRFTAVRSPSIEGALAMISALESNSMRADEPWRSTQAARALDALRSDLCALLAEESGVDGWIDEAEPLAELPTMCVETRVIHRTPAWPERFAVADRGILVVPRWVAAAAGVRPDALAHVDARMLPDAPRRGEVHLVDSTDHPLLIAARARSL